MNKTLLTFLLILASTFGRSEKKPPDEDKKTKRDWLALGISASALCVSLLTAYVSTLRATDYVKIFISSIPPFDITKQGVETSMDVLFLNGGNRAFMVTNVSFAVDEHAEKSSRCSDTQDYRTTFDSQMPLIVEPGKISKLVSHFNAKVHRRPGDEDLDLAWTPGDYISVCLKVDLATPSETKSEYVTLAGTNFVGSSDYIQLEGGGGLGPLPIYSKTQTVFFER